MLIIALAAYISLLSVARANPNFMDGWAYQMVHNPVVEAADNAPYLALATHFLAGILFALVYGYYVAPRSTLPSWMKGTIFAMGPFAFSVFVVFPSMGAGVLGSQLGAGPLPVAGNLLLHLAYGLSLGILYSPMTDRVMAGDRPASAEQLRYTVESSERGGTLGLVVGSIAGLVLGSLTMEALGDSTGVLSNVPGALVPLAATLVGSGLGCLVGLLLGPPGGMRISGYE
jgi:hypothetical protein